MEIFPLNLSLAFAKCHSMWNLNGFIIIYYSLVPSSSSSIPFYILFYNGPLLPLNALLTELFRWTLYDSNIFSSFTLMRCRVNENKNARWEEKEKKFTQLCNKTFYNMVECRNGYWQLYMDHFGLSAFNGVNESGTENKLGNILKKNWAVKKFKI